MNYKLKRSIYYLKNLKELYITKIKLKISLKKKSKTKNIYL
jgi:hypothetical protein